MCVRACMHVCVRACVRARVRACMCSRTLSFNFQDFPGGVGTMSRVPVSETAGKKSTSSIPLKSVNTSHQG